MDSMTQVSEEHKFSAISEPDFDLDAVEVPDTGAMTFEFDLEVRPSFDLPDWKGMQITRSVHDYSEEEINTRLGTLLDRFATSEPKEGPVAEGDMVELGITFKKGAEVVSQASETVRVLPKLSFPNGTMENFAEIIIGAEVGDTKQGTVTISDQAGDESLRGEEISAELDG